MTDTPRLGRIDWRWALPRIALVFLVSRLLVLSVAVAVETTQPSAPPEAGADPRPLVTSLTSWDGLQYIDIANDGYRFEDDGPPDYAWYPGYPLLVRAVSFVTAGDTAIAAILASNVAMFLALVALYALSTRHLGARPAIWSLWFLCLAPGAAAFTLSYSESLFLLFAVSAFLAAETRHDVLAGIALALATLTRVPGILLVIPLLLVIVDRDGWRPTRAWLPLALAPLVLAGWFAFMWAQTGDFLASVTAQDYWDGPLHGPGWQIPGWMSNALAISYLAVMLFYLILFIFFRQDRIRPAYWVVAGISFASVFLSGKLLSSTRFLAVAWPFDWVLGNRPSRVERIAVLVVFAALQAALLWVVFGWYIAP